MNKKEQFVEKWIKTFVGIILYVWYELREILKDIRDKKQKGDKNE